MKSKKSDRSSTLRKSKGKVDLKTLSMKSVQKSVAIKSAKGIVSKAATVKSAKTSVKKPVVAKSPAKKSALKSKAKENAQKVTVNTKASTTKKVQKEAAKTNPSTKKNVQRGAVKAPTRKSAQKSAPMKSAKKSQKVSTNKRTQSQKNQSLKKKPIKKNKFELRGEALKLHNKKSYLTYKPEDATSDWSGNSDDEGSVMSAVLEENICFECGRSTLEDDKNTIVMCDRCDGEYHAACQQLERIPRISWKCKDCVNEEKLYNASDYKLDIFKIQRKRSAPPPEICYSPSRPLDLAWNECLQKGFMVVKKVFTYDIMRKLTHGIVQKTTRSGRTAETWIGAVNILSERLGDTCHNVVNRDGRFDIRIPDFVVSELGIEEKLQEILNRLSSIMSTSSPPQIRTHDIIMAPVGSVEQPWHVDDAVRKGKKHRYFTILIHLNPIDSMCGGTEVWSKSLKRGDMIRGRPGDAFIFNGTLLHRGQANYGSTHRFFYYASFSCKADENAE